MVDPDVRRGVRRGVIMVATAGVCWSLQGLTIRLIEVALPEQIVFWRSVSQFAVLFVLLGVFSRGRMLAAFRTAGAIGLLGGGCVMVASTSFVFAVSHTTVANVVFVLAAAPLFASLLAWVVLGEVVPRRTLGAMLVALLGIAIMGTGGDFDANLTGNLFALAATLGFAGLAVVARYGRGMSMFPATCWGALGTIGMAYLLCGGDIAAPAKDIGWAMTSGGVLTASGATLFLLGARYVPAGVLAFLTLTEVVLAPLWVWIGFDEVPGRFTLIGGAVVLAAIVAEALWRLFSRGSEGAAGPGAGQPGIPAAPAAASIPDGATAPRLHRHRSSAAPALASIVTGLILLGIATAMILAD